MKGYCTEDTRYHERVDNCDSARLVDYAVLIGIASVSPQIEYHIFYILLKGQDYHIFKFIGVFLRKPYAIFARRLE